MPITSSNERKMPKSRKWNREITVKNSNTNKGFMQYFFVEISLSLSQFKPLFLWWKSEKLIAKGTCKRVHSVIYFWITFRDRIFSKLILITTFRANVTISLSEKKIYTPIFNQIALFPPADRLLKFPTIKLFPGTSEIPGFALFRSIWN